MASLIVGNWECTFHEVILVVMRCTLPKEPFELADYFKTSRAHKDIVKTDLQCGKINNFEYIFELLCEWRSRVGREATLEALLEILENKRNWSSVRDELQNFLISKAQIWDDLDKSSKLKVCETLVEHQGYKFKLKVLQLIMGKEFKSFMEKSITQNVLRQVVAGEVLLIEDLRRGFLENPQPGPAQPSFEITYDVNEVLGYGSGNAVVCKGSFGANCVAVKILSKYQYHAEFENEIKFLQKCTGDPNILRLFASEIRVDKCLLVLELCLKQTLSDWIIRPDCIYPREIKELDILRQVTDGLAFLHGVNIIHGDLKPSNILFFPMMDARVIVKLADFGISRLLDTDKVSVAITTCSGTYGWCAPELLEAGQRLRQPAKHSRSSTKLPATAKLSKKTDIFSLGVIFYKVLRKGKHPFGSDETLLDDNILKGKIRTESNSDCLRLHCNLSLIHTMIGPNPEQRPDAAYIKTHPIFWPEEKMLNFVVDASNFMADQPAHKKDSNDRCDCKVCICENKLDGCYYYKLISADFKDEGWLIQIDDQEFKNHDVFKSRFESSKKSAVLLIRLIRNFSNHFHEKQNQDLKRFVGEKPQNFMNSWLKWFPTLINEMRVAFEELKEEKSLSQYFT